MLRSWHAVLLVVVLVGCGNDSKSSSPKPPKGAEDSGGVLPPGDTPGTTPIIDGPSTSVTAADLEIEPASASGTSFEFDGSDPISIDFRVTGDNGATVAVALLDAPSGASLRGASSSRPTFSWTSPREGTHTVRFLLRDMDACEKAEGSLARCRLEETVGSTQGRYDKTSDRYTVKVGDGSSTSITSGNNTGSNDDLISQILQGFGGGNSDLTTLLQGLSGGQLQQILQGQGSGLDLSTLIQLVQGFGLADSTEIED